MHRGQEGTDSNAVTGKTFRAKDPSLDPEKRSQYEKIIRTPKQKYDVIVARGIEKGDTYCKINSVLEITENQPVMTLDQLIEAYVTYSMDYRDEKTILEGMSRIAKAYAFAEEEFRKLGERDPNKAFRKDKKTPTYAHSTRLAVMAAYFGAGSNIIAGLLCHDVIEDCGVSYKTLRKTIGDVPAKIVALLTKPKIGEKGPGSIRWVFLAGNPRQYETTKDLSEESDYESRIREQYGYILNCRIPGFTAAIKLKAYVGKILDALDNLVSDRHLDPIRAGIRHTILLGQTVHLEVVSPGLKNILRRLLEERQIPIPAKIISRPKPESEVIELRLPDKHLNTDYLNRMPLPNGHIIVYADDDEIRAQLAKGTYRDWLRIELPHHAPDDYVEKAAEYYLLNGMFLRFRGGLSLLPCASEASGKIMDVQGINTTEDYSQFKELLFGYRKVLDMRYAVEERLL